MKAPFSAPGGLLRHLLIAVLLSFPAAVSAQLVDKVVAIVNDEVITLSEVEEEAARIYQNISTEGPVPGLGTSMAEVRESTINGLIDRRLINQRAKATNTTVSDEELQAAMETTRTRMGLDPAAFRKKMEQTGMTEDALKKQLRDQILQGKLVSMDVRAKTVVTDEMVREYFNRNHSAGSDKGNLYLLQMGFAWNAKSKDEAQLAEEKAEARKRAEQARALVEDGQDFSAVAKKFSELPSAVDGGDLGLLHLDDLAKATRAAIAELKPGKISEIVETADSYQFFKVLSEKDKSADEAAFDKVKEDIREKLLQEKLKTAYAEWVKKLRDTAYIQKL